MFFDGITLPENWKKARVKNILDYNHHYPIGDGDHGSIKPEMYQDYGIPYIRVQNLSWGFKINYNNLVYISDEINLANSKSILIPKDILIAKTGATVGKMAIVPKSIKQANTTSSVGKITINHELFNYKYFAYLFSSSLFQEQIKQKSYQKSAQPGFNIDDLVEFKILIPPLNTQKQIANYLDKKTSKIDTTIAKNKELINLLEEKRTALINQVVTKGLNPEVPMKDSGVEWIGEIPENWDIVLFKRLFNQIRDGTHGSFERVDNGEPLLSAKNIFNNQINLAENESCISKDDFLSIVSNGFPKKNDLLMTIVGTIGRSCVYDKDFPLAFQRSVSFIRLNKDNPYYYNYFIKSEIFQSQLHQKAKQSAQKGVYLNDIKECIVINPPHEIQNEIANYLQDKTLKIDRTISKIKENINLLEEYKTSLIHHVVTGKIDVRGEEL